MSNVQRWDFDARTDLMQPFDDGMYVEYDDYARLESELKRARAVLGPDCPRCGRYLKVEHRRELVFDGVGLSKLADGYKSYQKDEPATCRVTIADLLANHPDIAHEMGLTK